MNTPLLRAHVEEALRRLDDTQAFERMIRELLSADGWIVQPRGSRVRGGTDGGQDFHALKSGLEYAGQSYHPAQTVREPLKKVRRKIRDTHRRLRAQGDHPGRLLLVTSARIDDRQLVPKRPRAGARPEPDVLVLDGDWIVEKLLDPRNSWLLNELQVERSSGVLRPKAYLDRFRRRGVQSPAWVGRVPDRDAVLAALQQSDVVLVSGVGGVGKSRLVGETALFDESESGQRPWFFLAEAASPRTWSLELPVRNECVVVLDDPQRRPSLLREAMDLLRGDGRPPVRLVLTLRPDKLREVRALLDSALTCAEIEVEPLDERESAELVRNLGLKDTADVAELARLCEGNPQIACLLAPLRARGTRFQTWADGLGTFIEEFLGCFAPGTERLMGFISAFPELPLFESPDPARPATPGTPFHQNGLKLAGKLREICGMPDSHVHQLLDDLQDTGFVERRRSRHGVSLVVIPDILAEAFVARAYFSRDDGPDRYRQEVMNFSADTRLDGDEDRLASAALRSASPRATSLVEACCREKLRGMRGDRGIDVLHGLIELRRFVPVVPAIGLQAARQILDHGGVAVGDEHGIATPEAVVGCAVVLIRQALDGLPEESQAAAIELLVRLADRQAEPVGIESAHEALVGSVATGRVPPVHRLRRLRALAAWWRAMPDERAHDWGRVLVSVLRSIRWGDDVPGLDELVIAALDGFRELASLRSPVRDAATLHVLETLLPEACSIGGTAAADRLLDAADGVLREWSERPLTTIGLRAAAFDMLATWNASGVPMSQAGNRLWTELLADDDVRLHRHLEGTYQRWTDEGLRAKEHWIRPDGDPVLIDRARRAEADLAGLLDVVTSMRGERLRGGPPLRFDWLGMHLARRSTRLVADAAHELMARQDPRLVSLVAGALAELWHCDVRGALRIAEVLEQAATPIALDVLAGSLTGVIPRDAWKLVSTLARANAEFASRLLDHSFRWEGATPEADRFLLDLAARADARHGRSTLDRVKPSGDPVADAQGLAIVARLIRAAGLDRNAWGAWAWVRALAAREPSAFVDALIGACTLRLPVRSGREALPLELIHVASSLPRELPDRARLVDVCLEWIDAEGEPMAHRAEALLREILTPAEIEEQSALAMRSGESRSRLEALAPWLETARFVELLTTLAERADESELARLERLAWEHVDPSGVSMTRLSGVPEMERIARTLALDTHANVAELGRRLAVSCELRREEASVDD